MPGKPLLAAIVVASSMCASAATTTYSDAASFLNDAGPVDFDSFEDMAAMSEAESVSRHGYSITSTISGDGFGLYTGFGSTPFGTFATDGERYLINQSDAGESLLFSFDVAISAFAFSVTDWDNPLGTSSARLMLGNDAGDKVLVTATPMLQGESLFFGIVNAGFVFTEVTLFNTANNEAYGIDGVYFSRPIPLPGAVWLLGSALLGGMLGGRRR